jgi:hypothetical protein
MVRTVAPVLAGRPVWIALGLFVSVLAAHPVQAQTPAAPPAGGAAPAPAGGAAPAQAQPVSNARQFPNDAGIVLNFIKPDHTADFEMVMAKLKEALQKSERPERKQQAAGWKVFKSPDPAGMNVLYVFLVDPSVKGADYQVSNIIAENFPAAEATDILKKYADAYAQGMNIVNLNVVQDLAK